MADDSASRPAADLLREEMDAAERLARLIGGEDDQRFILVFHSLVNLVDQFNVRPGDEGTRHARSVLMRSAEPHATRPATGRRGAVSIAPGPVPDSIYSDPVFLENAKRLIPNRTRVIGGVVTTDFPDCVAIGSPTGWCCTGTLVAPNVVVTAGHCVAGGCGSRAFVGPDVTMPDQGQVIQVVHATAHPDYHPPDPTRDLSVLILADDANVSPRAIADAEMLSAAATARLAGYGNTDVYSTGGYGKRRMVDVPVASTDPRFGADPATEFVAGAPFLDRDSCNGDSGGPAYIFAGGDWYLAGATSRATASTIRPCGDGGIYTRVQVYEDWVKSVPGGHWV